MRAPRTLVLALGAVAAVGAVLVSRPGSAAPGDTQIAVVSVLQVINDSPQKAAIEQRQKDRETAAKSYALEQDGKLKGMRAEVEALGRTSPARREKEDAYVRAEAAVEAELKIRKARAVDDYTTDYENLYQDVKAVIEQVARARGYRVVLFKTDDPISLRSPSEFAVNVGMRTVVWADTALDITEAVKEGVKSRLPRPGGEAPPGPPGAVPPGSVPPPGPPVPSMDR